MTWIHRLDEPAEAARCGGKWQGLTRLHTLGAPVPEAFCVSAEAYREMAAGSEVAGLVAALDAGSPDPALPGHIRQAIEATPLPPALREALATEIPRFGDISLAVRSSATGEDGSTASFAGQYDTLLGVRGLTAVMDAMRHCWASAFGDRAVAYRRERGLAHAEVAMAVVVQRLVDASTSGVTFTRHPTEDRPVMLFEACRGLGEALVSGRTDPDRFEVDREGPGLDILSTAATTNLPGERLLAMRDLFLELEQDMGHALDLEWSWQGDRLFVLQARPITTAAGPATAERSEAGALTGTAAAPGRASGVARVILDPDDDDLEPGEVLITEFTDPRFMRHFHVAGALVMEHGGMLSHGAIVARECGIPAVIGVENATRRISTGNDLLVDGDAGVVSLRTRAAKQR